MAEIEVRGLTSRPHAGRSAVRDVSLGLADGEVLALLGPSGSGKTTLLRLVAGLEQVAQGEVVIGGQVVNDLPAHERDLALVTEQHALLEHLDVERNIGFSLKLRRLSAPEIFKRVRSEARVFGLSRLLRRRPRTLSAGQQQAAAVARATVRVPSAYLLDEPLSRIDARERERLRAEVARYVRGLGVTALLATNDQSDALAVADRVAVLRDGCLEQVGAPQRLYGEPADVFVASFLGDPGMNVLRGVLEAGATTTLVRLGSRSLPLTGVAEPARRRYDGAPVLLGVRPEDLALADPGRDDALPGVVERVEHLGHETRVALRLDAPGEPGAVVRVRPPATVPATGERVGMAARGPGQHLFDPATEQAVWHGGGPS